MAMLEDYLDWKAKRFNSAGTSRIKRDLFNFIEKDIPDVVQENLLHHISLFDSSNKKIWLLIATLYFLGGIIVGLIFSL